MQDFPDQKQFKALFDFATEGILVSDTAGLIQLANASAERLFEYEAGELAGKKVEILMPARFAGDHTKLRKGFNAHPRPKSMGNGRDLFGIAKSGREFPVEISLSPYSTETGSFTVAFIIDISVRKKNEESIIKQKAELEALTFELEKRVKELEALVKELLKEKA